MDSYQQQQQPRRLIGGDHPHHQPPQGPFWFPSSSPPPPPAPPGPGVYPHQPSYSHHSHPPPPPLPQQHQWLQQQQPLPLSMAMPPSLPPYHGNHPQIPSPYPHPPPPPHLHQYPPPHLPRPLPPHQHHLPPPPLPSAYPPPNQSWGNPSWAQDQGWEYSERNIPYNNEEDWAARAKAWAASKYATESHPTQSHFTPTGRTDEHGYAFHDHYQQTVAAPTDILQSSLPQSNSQQLPISMMDSQKQVNHLHGSTSFSSVSSSYNTDGLVGYTAGDGALTKDRDHMSSPQTSYAASSSIFEQEVPYSYSFAPGNREAVGQSESSRMSQPLLVPSVQEGHHPHSTPSVPKISVEQPHFASGGQSTKFLTDASAQPVDFEARLASDHEAQQRTNYGHAGPGGLVGVMDHEPSTGSIHAWTQIPLGPSGAQFDPSFTPQASLPVHSTPVFGSNPALNFRPGMPPISAPFGPGAPLHATAFSGDANGSLSISERPRKAAVPNWLREEIIKKKSVITNTVPTPPTEDSFHSNGSEDINKSFRGADQADSKSIDSTRSTEDEEDDEDDVEAARLATINQEIKSVLTEVLLKVTDELFEEIARKVLNEDEPTVEVEETAVLGKHKVSPPPAISTPKASAKILVPHKVDNNRVDSVGENSRPSPLRDVLGLGNYASDASDDDEEDRSSRLLSSRKMVDVSSQKENNYSLSENVPKVVEKGNSVVSTEVSQGPHDLEIEGKGTIDGAPQKHGARTSERNHTAKNGSSSDDKLFYYEKGPEGTSGIYEEMVSVDSGKVSDYPLESANALQHKDTADGKGSRRSASTSGRANDEKSSTGEPRGRDSKRNLGTNKNPEKKGEKEPTEVKSGMHYSGRETSNASSSIIQEDRNKMEDKRDRSAKLKERADEINAKRGSTLRESDSRSSKHDNNKDDRRESAKDKRQKSKEDDERKRERTRDKREDRPPGVTKESFRYSNRSPSPSARGRNSRDNSFGGHGGASSDEPSDNSKKRKLQPINSNFSPSPPRSRKRQVSRSPPSKHSHRRNSPYSSQDRSRRRRSRSTTPNHRRRSAAHKRDT